MTSVETPRDTKKKKKIRITFFVVVWPPGGDAIIFIFKLNLDNYLFVRFSVEL